MRKLRRRFLKSIRLLLCVVALLLPGLLHPRFTRANDRATYGSFHELYQCCDTMIAADVVDCGEKSFHAKITTAYWGRCKVGDEIEVSLEHAWMPRLKPDTKLLMLGKFGEKQFILANGEQGLIENPTTAVIDYYKAYRDAIQAEAAHPDVPVILPLLMQGLESPDERILVEAAWDLDMLSARTKPDARAALWTGPQQAQVLKRVRDLVEHAAEQTQSQINQKQILMRAAYRTCGNTPEVRALLWAATRRKGEKFQGVVSNATQLLIEHPETSETDQFMELTKDPSGSMTAGFAMVALMKIGNEKAIARLTEIRDAGSDPGLRQSARQILEYMLDDLLTPPVQTKSP